MTDTTAWQQPPDWPGAPEHRDCICAPNPAAQCICGDPFADHAEDDAHWFILACSESLDCPDAEPCGICEALICREHSDEFRSCDLGGIHRESCWPYCQTCVGVARADAEHERADAIRKGEL